VSYTLLSIVFGVAWWVVWKERPSTRVWGIIASLAYLFIYIQPILVASGFVWWHSLFDLVFGVLGLVIFNIKDDEDSQAKALDSFSNPS
jgi:hypothetical protein